MDEFDVDHDDEIATPEELEANPPEPLKIDPALQALLQGGFS